MADSFNVFARVRQFLKGNGAADQGQLTTDQAGPTNSWDRNPYGGHPAAGLTPRRLAEILRSSISGKPMEYLELAEDMEERFPQYGTTLSTRKRQVSSLDFVVNAAGDDKASQDEAQLVRDVLQTAAFRLSKIDQLDAIGKGFSAVEMNWQTVAGQLRPVSFKFRDPRFFEFDRLDPEKILLRDGGGLVDLIEHKWLVHRAKAKSGLTIRGGLARQVAWIFLFQSFTLKDWAIFCEAYGQPVRVGKYDSGASEADKRALLEAVRQIGTDYAAIIPLATQLEFVQASITGSTDLYERRALFLERQISKIVLGQTGTTDVVQGGGYASSKVHDGVRDDIEDADAEQWAATLNDQLVIPLVSFNFNNPGRESFPEIEIGRPEEEDVAALVANVKELVPLGLEVDMAEMQKKIGVTPPKPGARLLVAPRPAPAADTPTPEDVKQGKDDKPNTASALLGRRDDSVDRAISDMLGQTGWEPLVTSLGDELRNRLAAATDAEEAQSILAASFADLDVAALTELLARSMFASRLAGELGETL